MLAAFDFELGVGEQRPARAPRSSRRPVFRTIRPGRSGGLKEKRRLRLSRCSARGPVALLLVDLFDPRLRLFGLRRLVAEALDEALHPLDLRLLAVDRLAEGDLARRLLLAPGVPGAGEEAGRAAPPAPAPRCRPPRGTSGRGRRGRRRRRGRPGSAPATPARGCRGGWWARRAAAGRGGWRARGPARRGSARRRRRSRAGARRARRRSRGRAARRAPRRASGSRRRLRAAAGRPRRRAIVSSSGAARDICRLQPRQLGLGLEHVGAAGEDVVAERGRRVARRALVVQGDPGAALRATRLPESGASSPASTRSSVDLPAPLRPESVIRSRGSSLKETSSNSSLPPTWTSREVAVAIAIAARIR